MPEVPGMDPPVHPEPGETPPAIDVPIREPDSRTSALNGGPPCGECEEWHERLISEARNLQIAAGAVLVGLLVLAVVLYARGR